MMTETLADAIRANAAALGRFAKSMLRELATPYTWAEIAALSALCLLTAILFI
jgi:hypothetical protein